MRPRSGRSTTPWASTRSGNPRGCNSWWPPWARSPASPLVVLVAGALGRPPRIRLVAVAGLVVAAGTLAFLLAVPAHPTTYLASPVAYTAEAIAAGSSLYAAALQRLPRSPRSRRGLDHACATRCAARSHRPRARSARRGPVLVDRSRRTRDGDAGIHAAVERSGHLEPDPVSGRAGGGRACTCDVGSDKALAAGSRPGLHVRVHRASPGITAQSARPKPRDPAGVLHLAVLAAATA